MEIYNEVAQINEELDDVIGYISGKVQKSKKNIPKTIAIDAPLEDIINYVRDNLKINRYVPLSKANSQKIRDYYRKQLKNKGFTDNEIDYGKGSPIYLKNGQKLADMYDRIVIGDYGPYIEISKDDMVYNLRVKSGEEWRTKFPDIQAKKRYYPLKYVWYETDTFDKVYYQVGEVRYADYQKHKYYISPDAIKHS